MTFMDALIERADRRIKANRTKLTATEAAALRLVAMHGPPDHPDLKSAVAKLRIIEAGGE